MKIYKKILFITAIFISANLYSTDKEELLMENIAKKEKGQI